MSLWFEQMIQKGAVVTGPILMEKADQFAIQLDIPDFKANVGWLQRWKKSQNIYFKKIHGESASADTDSAESFKRNVLPALLEKYALNEIYNADETGLFYKALPDGTYGYGKSQQSGPKSSKDRITLLFITNATGTDKYVYSIGKYKQPRCFRGKKVPIPYKSNKKAWMTSTIWGKIIRELDEKLKIKGQKILLLIDNASCHKLDFSPESIKIIFLPPCTTSIIQPLDQGIIQSFKSHYRKNLIREQILAVEGDYMEQFLNSVNILRALYIAERSWRLVTPETIRNCFKKAGISKDDPTNEIYENISDEEEIVLDHEYDSFLKELDEIEKYDCFGSLVDTDILNEVQEEDSGDGEAADEVQTAAVPKPTRKEAIKALFVLKQYFSSENNNDLISIENLLYKQRDKDLVQKKIENYFKS